MYVRSFSGNAEKNMVISNRILSLQLGIFLISSFTNLILFFFVFAMIHILKIYFLTLGPLESPD